MAGTVIEIGEQVIVVEVGDAVGPPLPSALGHEGEYLAAGPDGAWVYSEGTGADAGLRGDLAADGASITKAADQNQDMQAVINAQPHVLRMEASGPITEANGFADSFSVSPYAILPRAATLLGIGTFNLDAVSGRASVSAQQAMDDVAVDAAIPEFWMHGQNDDHHFGAAGPLEFGYRLLDFAGIVTSILFLRCHADGDPNKQRGADGAFANIDGVTPHAWVADTDFTTAGAMVSDQLGDIGSWIVEDTQYVVIHPRSEEGGAARYKISFNNIAHLGPDGQGFRTAPFSSFASDCGEDIHRTGLFFNLGRRHKKLKVQIELLTDGEPVGIHTVQGLNGDEIDGPWLFVGDLSDRNADDGGFSPAAPNADIAEAALPALSRTIMQVAGLVAAAGGKVADLPIAAAIDWTDGLVDGLHPDSTNCDAAAAAIDARVRAALAGQGLFGSRLALAVAGLIEDADGYPFMAGLASIRGSDGRSKRDRFDGRSVYFAAPFNYITTQGELRVIFDDGTGAAPDTSKGLALDTDGQHVNIGAVDGAGICNLWAFGASRVQATGDAMHSTTAYEMSCGKLTHPWSYVCSASYYVGSDKVVGSRGAALPTDATDLASAIALANAIKARLKVTGGHGLVED